VPTKVESLPRKFYEQFASPHGMPSLAAILLVRRRGLVKFLPTGKFGLPDAYKKGAVLPAPAVCCEHASQYRRGGIMKNPILQPLSRLHNEESGQGLVEYLLLLALVGFAATAGMSGLASGINTAFNTMANRLGGYIT
jgi:pilus assembly protein Flp/PilA